MRSSEGEAEEEQPCQTVKSTRFDQDLEVSRAVTHGGTVILHFLFGQVQRP
jgi:hypothetical protein